MDIEVFIRKLRNLQHFVNVEGNRIAMKEAPLIESMQRKRLSKGKTTENKTIQKGYSPGYAKRRKKKGLQTNYVDLNFSGEFYESLQVTEEPNYGSFDIVSDVDYARFLFDKHEDIVGLNKKDAHTLKKVIIERLEKSLRNYLFA